MRLELSLKLRRGSFSLDTDVAVNEPSTGVLGRSGAGKSTMFGLIAGTIQPESGRICLDGKILFDSRKGIMVPREQRPVGAVLQQDRYPSGLLVKDILNSTYSRTLKERRLFGLDYLIGLFGLEHCLDSPPNQLSAGEKHRISVVRSLLKAPRILLLDNTFNLLGPLYRYQLLSILRQLHREREITVLYASQSLGEIVELTDQLIILDAGKVVRAGSLTSIVKAEGMNALLGLGPIDNVLSVQILGHEPQNGCTTADLFGSRLVIPLREKLPLGSGARVMIKSIDIALSKRYITEISIQNQMKGRICALIPSGQRVFVQIDCGATLVAEVTLRACRDMDLKEGQSVYCLVKAHAIRYLSELGAGPYAHSSWSHAWPGQSDNEPSGYDASGSAALMREH